jgi:hypothetical protein
MKKLLLSLLLLPSVALAQVNLNSTIPAPQVKGITQAVNGGTGINSTGMTGCVSVAAGVWSISTANCSGAAVPFAITSFTGCSGSYELGQTITNPTCSATYSATPTSAQITNTDGINSPLTLSTPFTSGTITGSFSHSTVTTLTITLNAVGTSTQSANQTSTWNPRIFGGVGTTGATSTVTASGTTAFLSTSNALASAGLAAEVVGQTFGPFAPSGQAVYLLLKGGSHTFIDAGTGFPFAFNSPLTVTFVNQYGVSSTYYLYASTNPLTGTFTPRVAS